MGVYRLLGVLAFTLLCSLPQTFAASKGQKVRSSPDIPVTAFSCTGRPPGYYADVEAGCQVYHMCTEGGNQFSYRCPNTTLFQQRMLICAHWYQVNCSKSDLYVGANLLIGQRDKPFVDEDPFNTREKQIKTLQNPDTLQNLGQASRDAKSLRQGKAQFSNDRVFQNNLKRDNQPQVSTSRPQFTFSTTEPPFNNRRTPDDFSSLPIAGSVLPGGFRNFQFTQSTQRGFAFNNPTTTFSSTAAPFQANSFNSQPSSPSAFTRQSASSVSFASPSPSPLANRVNSFATTRSPVSFTTKLSQDNFNTLQPSGFQKTSTTVNRFSPSVSTQSPNFTPSRTDFRTSPVNIPTSSTPSPQQEEFVGGGLPEIENIIKAEIEQPPSGSLPLDRYNTFIKRFNPFEQPPTTTTEKPQFSFTSRQTSPKPSFDPAGQDLTVASQENLVSSRRSTPPPVPDQEDFVGGGLPQVDNIIKAEIEQPANGSLPVDKFNTFLTRFNPLEEPPKPSKEVRKPQDSQEEHTFINRFIPDETPLVTGYNLEEQPGEPEFINRFVLTPDELMQDKNAHEIEKLHNLQPPEAQISVNFPNFELTPPLDDSDDSESNKIELHLQDPRRNFFIPNGDESTFSKADAAPIVVTIPLHSNQKNIPMLFKTNSQEDSCSRCHPSFIVNKQTCMPCVVIR